MNDDWMMPDSIWAHRYRTPGGIASDPRNAPGHTADAIGRLRQGQQADSEQLRAQLVPLQEILLGARAEGRESPDMEREPTIQAMLEILQRPGWSDSERQEYIAWMRDVGALPPLEDQMFGPPR